MVKLPPLAPGAYRLRYETRDELGGTAAAQREFLVAGDAPLAVAAWLEVQRPSVRPGETAAVVVHSGFPGQPLELEVRRGSGVERRAIVARAAPQRLELPVGEEDRGGIALRLVAVRDHQLLHHELQVVVPWDNRELKVEYQTFRDLLRPGARETWRVKVTRSGAGAGGAEPAAAELLAYMYDRSLDAYAPHRPPRPIDLFPQGVALGWLAVNLGGRSGAWWGNLPELPAGAGLHGDSLPVIAAYGVGGPGGPGLPGA